MVDDADYERLSVYSWRVSICKHGEYAVRTQTTAEVPRAQRKNVYMHSMIIDVPDNMVCHHKNETGLDNQAQNLEPVTRFENWRYYAESTKTKESAGVPF